MLKEEASCLENYIYRFKNVKLLHLFIFKEQTHMKHALLCESMAFKFNWWLAMLTIKVDESSTFHDIQTSFW